MLKTFSMTDVGKKRRINQDYVFTSEVPVGNLPNLFIVADGMGGHKAGDYASRCAATTIVEAVKASSETRPISIITSAVEAANKAVYDKANAESEYSGMGTTCVVASVIDDVLYVANVGDSRLYVMDDELRQITKDHSLVEEMIRVGEIDRVSARTHPDKNIITRAVGASAEVRIDFFDIHLKPGDQILMCSDGLTNMVEDDDIVLTLSSSADVAGKTLELIEKANINGGRDNIAVIVIEPFGEE